MVAIASYMPLAWSYEEMRKGSSPSDCQRTKKKKKKEIEREEPASIISFWNYQGLTLVRALLLTELYGEKSWEKRREKEIKLRYLSCKA